MGRTGALPCKLYMEEGGEKAGDGGKGRGIRWREEERRSRKKKTMGKLQDRQDNNKRNIRFRETGLAGKRSRRGWSELL